MKRNDRKRVLWVLTAGAVLSLSGCAAGAVLPRGQEVEHIALMRTLGIDADEKGVEVTAGSGVQSRGTEQSAQPPLVLSHSAPSVSAACLAMQSYGTDRIFFGHVGQLLLGESLARQGVQEALGYVEQDIEMRLDTEVYVVKGGEAGEAIRTSAGSQSAAADRLEALADDAGVMASSMPRMAKDLLVSQARSGAAFVPAVELRSGPAAGVETGGAEEDQQEQKEQELAPAGYAILKDNVLVGWAEGEAASGVNLMMSRVEADILELETAYGRGVVRVVGCSTRVRPVFSGGQLTGIEVRCAVEANLAQASDGLDLTDREALSALDAALSEAELARLRAVLALSQELDADFLELLRRCGVARPWRGAALEAQGKDAFARLELKVEVSGRVRRSYDVQ